MHISFSPLIDFPFLFLPNNLTQKPSGLIHMTKCLKLSDMQNKSSHYFDTSFHFIKIL